MADANEPLHRACSRRAKGYRGVPVILNVVIRYSSVTSAHGSATGGAGAGAAELPGAGAALGAAGAAAGSGAEEATDAVPPGAGLVVSAPDSLPPPHAATEIVRAAAKAVNNALRVMTSPW
ncbi:hypothetical protein NWFMUON74_69640 [Nocardia wallacei]|uniref:Uncharacterized protein n=1 Tax=Nocardia wallacei TaxID=480035 RepID=A0A7G1KVT9_9NOCA|nr:hypothetical protein NWFMUON74_69640 [Nocardia wallacei]